MELPPYFFLGKLEVYRTGFLCGLASFLKAERGYQVEEFSKVSLYPLKFRIMLSVYRSHFTILNLYSFSFSCLISLVKIGNIIVSKSGKYGKPCLIPNFRGFSVTLAIDL